MSGNHLLLILMIEYVLLAIVYGTTGNWPKSLYFIGATMLSVGVLLME